MRGSFFLLLLLSASQSAWGAVQYAVTSLGFVPTAINNSGQVVGNAGYAFAFDAYTTVHTFSAAVCHNRLGSLAQTPINNSGQVAGSANSGAAVYSGRAVQILITGDYPQNAAATGISDNGQVVGLYTGDTYGFLYSGGIFAIAPWAMAADWRQ